MKKILSIAMAFVFCFAVVAPVASAATDIPDFIPDTETAPGGNMTGDLVKYETGNRKHDSAELAIIAAALSTVVGAPYSTVLAVLSVYTGIYEMDDVYYSIANYRVWGAGSFQVMRIFSDSDHQTVESTSDPYWIDS